MAVLSIHKATALPGSLAAHSIYIIAPPAKPDYVEIYVTDASSVAKRLLNEVDVQGLIDAAVAGMDNLLYAADITARDALVLTANAKVYVADASDDATVESGGATYFYYYDEEEWIKTSEEESLEIEVSWSALSGKPSSTVSDIDDAVSKRHTHANKSQLDKIDQDGDGNLTYDGSLPKTAWASTGW